MTLQISARLSSVLLDTEITDEKSVQFLFFFGSTWCRNSARNNVGFRWLFILYVLHCIVSITNRNSNGKRSYTLYTLYISLLILLHILLLISSWISSLSLLTLACLFSSLSKSICPWSDFPAVYSAGGYCQGSPGYPRCRCRAPGSPRCCLGPHGSECCCLGSFPVGAERNQE